MKKTLFVSFAFLALTLALLTPWGIRSALVAVAGTPSPNPSSCYPIYTPVPGVPGLAVPMANELVHSETCSGQLGDTFSDGQFFTPAPTSTANSFQVSLPANTFSVVGRRTFGPPATITALASATTYCYLDSSGFPYGIWNCNGSATPPNVNAELEYTITANSGGVTAVATPLPADFHIVAGSYYGNGSHLTGVPAGATPTPIPCSQLIPGTNFTSITGTSINGSGCTFNAAGGSSGISLQMTSSPSPQSGSGAVTGTFGSGLFLWNGTNVPAQSGAPANEPDVSAQLIGINASACLSVYCEALNLVPKTSPTTSPALNLLWLGCGTSGSANVCSGSAQATQWSLAMQENAGHNTLYMGESNSAGCPSGIISPAIVGFNTTQTYSIGGVCFDGFGFDTGSVFTNRDSGGNMAVCTYNGSTGHGDCFGAMLFGTNHCDGSLNFYIYDNNHGVCYLEGDTSGNLTVKNNLTVDGTCTGCGSVAVPPLIKQQLTMSQFSASSSTLTFPETATSGDLLLLAVSTTNAAITTPSGWTLLRNGNIGSGDDCNLSVYYKVSAGTETNVSVAIATSETWTLSFIEISNAATPTNSVAATTTTQYTYPMPYYITPAASNSLLIGFAGNKPTFTGRGATFQAPPGWSGGSMVDNGGGEAIAVYIRDLPTQTADVSTALKVNGNQGGDSNTGWVTITVEIPHS